MTRHPIFWRWAAIALVVLIVGLAFWSNADRKPPAPSVPPVPSPTTPVPEASAPTPQLNPTAPTPPPPITIMPTATDLGAVIANRDDPTAALQGVDQALLFYRRAFGENPVGQNEDVTAAILGENPGHAAFLPPDSPAIKNGKLLDAWNTPYWFHPVSASHMEIRSAGPDRELFTDDDLILNK